jgi:Flp pilus assembly secretin CpaC
MTSFNTGLLVALFAAALTAPLHAQTPSDPPITVVMDQAKIVQLPENTATIVLGNPLIVDVTMLQKNQKMVLTGKTFGETNLIALDKSGAPIRNCSARL